MELTKWIVQDQIDHFMTTVYGDDPLLDMKVKSYAGVEIDHVVTAIIKLKMKKPFIVKHATTKMVWYSTAQRHLDKICSHTFNEDLRNRFEALQDLTDEQQEKDLNKVWKQIATIYIETSKKRLVFSKRNNNNWIKKGTLDAMEERRKS